MKLKSLLRLGNYSADWVRDFYAQATIWWGADPQDDPAVHASRAAVVERLCGSSRHRVLELGSGSGRTAAALVARGHDVVAVEMDAAGAAHARGLVKAGPPGSLTVIEADYYAVQLGGRFDVVCWWEGFGLGSDEDQRRMLRRIADEWLESQGSVLLEVYNPTRPARRAGEEVRLAPLPGVPGSVDMIERCHFDPIHCRWIDEWQPTQEPEKALAQALRCYTPADLKLLLEGTGLALRHLEFSGEEVGLPDERVAVSQPLLDAWGYLAQLVRAVDASSPTRSAP